MNIAQMMQTALGFFRTVQAAPVAPQDGIGGAAPKKVRKIGYGDSLRASFDAKRKVERDALAYAAKRG